MQARAKKDIVVIGGSSGSVAVLEMLMADLGTDLTASIFVSTHIPARSPGLLLDILARCCKLPVSRAIDGAAIEKGHVYVAAPNCHLLLIDKRIRLGMGPRENMVRPSIDPMFRSAALCFGSQVVGIVLTGMLSDGAAGLHAIKACGGTAIVQHPIDADVDEMPLAALRAVDVDHISAARDLGGLIHRMAATPAGPSLPPPAHLHLEVEIALGRTLGSAMLSSGAVSGRVPFFEDEDVSSFGKIDEAIRIAMRVMEERVTLVESLAKDARDTGRNAVADLYDGRAVEYRRHAMTLRNAAVNALGVAPVPCQGET
ncbi:two-component system chemotaxis response regulator CheB [Rhizobium sp. PP-CC-3A-592]|nr:two-component system chemotaxis response regulator CheB [Rhizobium sp. PP-CC-3A-592]